MRKYGLLVVFLLLCLSAGWIGSFFSADSVNGWYQSLNKPAWTPPNWVFGPVWTMLYLLMGIAVWLYWSKAADHKRTGGLTLFGAQLALNIFWTALLFGMWLPGWAFAEILVLIGLVIATMRRFHPATRKGAWLLAPYLIWICYAGALNFAIWRMNG